MSEKILINRIPLKIDTYAFSLSNVSPVACHSLTLSPLKLEALQD